MVRFDLLAGGALSADLTAFLLLVVFVATAGAGADSATLLGAEGALTAVIDLVSAGDWADDS